MRILLGGGATLLLVACLNCTELLARAIVTAPNFGKTEAAFQETADEELVRRGVSRELRIAVGPPAATLSIWIVDPPQAAPAATVLVLHGIHNRKIVMMPVAKMLAAQGYRAVLIDLRGHGQSSGDFLTFGVNETDDLSQVLDELDRRGLLAGRVGVYGASYGGGIGLQLAGRDERIAAVVSVAGFQSLRAVVPTCTNYYLPVVGSWIPASTIDAGLRRAGQLAAFDPDLADACAAIRECDAAALLIHGTADRKIPHVQAEAVAAAAGTDRGRCTLLDGENHDSIMADREGIIEREMLAWFEKWLCGEDSGS